ncbi:MAG TPA: NUDIX hydrolase [Vicinamibacterales bacterium]|nr:NUDIX hydrolase [Vicinamibacterales bacterium]
MFRVEQDRVRLPNGRTAVLDIVRHGGSVVLIAQPSPQSVVLIRQFRYAIDKWIWELPAGSIESGETPGRAARRECEEEIGLTPRRISRAGALYPTPGFCDEIMFFYRCTGLVKPTRRVKVDPDEQIEPRVLSLREAGRLVERGEIVDMKTILGLGLIRP